MRGSPRGHSIAPRATRPPALPGAALSFAGRPRRRRSAAARPAARAQRVDLRPAPGHARLPSRAAARLPAPPAVRHAVPGGRHRRRLAVAPQLVLAADAQRRGAEAAAQGAQGHARDLRARQPRRVRAALCVARLRRHRGGGRMGAHHRRWPPPVGHARRPVRRRDPVRQVAGAGRRQPVRADAAREPLAELHAGAARACRTAACRST